MPGTPEHPVTLGDLRVTEPHFPHPDNDGRFLTHRLATVADLVSALRAEGVLVVDKEQHKAGMDWPYWATDALEKLIYHDKSWPGSIRMLDALAEAQP